MVARNDITGDKIQTRDKLSEQGEQNFESIFGKRKTNGGWVPPTEIKTEEEFFERGKEIAREMDKAGMAKPVSTPTQPAEYAEDWQSSQRDRAIAQNGNVGYESSDDEAVSSVAAQSTEAEKD